MKEITCDCCGSEMKLEKTGHVNTERGAKCRIRRFKCPLCSRVDTIYADGAIDLYNPKYEASRLSKEAEGTTDPEEAEGTTDPDEVGYHCTHGLLIDDCLICKTD